MNSHTLAHLTMLTRTLTLAHVCTHSHTLTHVSMLTRTLTLAHVCTRSYSLQWTSIKPCFIWALKTFSEKDRNRRKEFFFFFSIDAAAAVAAAAAAAAAANSYLILFGAITFAQNIQFPRDFSHDQKFQKGRY